MEYDNFKESKVRQYKEEVHEIYIQSCHNQKFSAQDFNCKIGQVWRSAKVDGLDAEDFMGLVQDTMPEHYGEIIWPWPKAA